MKKHVVVRLLVDVPESAAASAGRRDDETAAKRHVAELLRRLPAGLLADFEVLRVEKTQPNKALWSE